MMPRVQRGLLPFGATLFASLLLTPAESVIRYQWDLSPQEGAIPDVGVRTFEFTISDSLLIADISVALIVPHTWQGDIKVNLLHGSGDVALFDRPGDPERAFGFPVDDYGDIQSGAEFRLSDGASLRYDVPDVVYPGIPQVSGSWKPDGNLSDFAGSDVLGTWWLRIEDFAAGDIGALRRFAIEFEPVPEIDSRLGLATGLGLLLARVLAARFQS